MKRNNAPCVTNVYTIFCNHFVDNFPYMTLKPGSAEEYDIQPGPETVALQPGFQGERFLRAGAYYLFFRKSTK